jgi:hypothetical protein
VGSASLVRPQLLVLFSEIHEAGLDVRVLVVEGSPLERPEIAVDGGRGFP